MNILVRHLGWNYQLEMLPVGLYLLGSQHASPALAFDLTQDSRRDSSLRESEGY
jgi:hypothetical protein